MAMDYKEDDAATLVSFGDGATSQGDFHEGMNFAGVFDTPTVFLCQNNQYAISTPFEKQTASDTIAEKAGAYGFEGVRVDGNDPAAVYQVLSSAMEKAREGGGPTLVEAVTYRLDDHTNSDDSTVYRDQEEVDEWREKDPVRRLGDYLLSEDILSGREVYDIWEDSEDELAAAVASALEGQEYDEPGRIFDHVFQQKTPRMKEQLREAGNR